MTYQFDFLTEYGQFYLCDKTSPMQTDSESFWTTQALEDNLAIEEGIIGIASEGHGRVEGELTILDSASEVTLSKVCDHVVEGSIAVPSGVVQLVNCPDSAVQLEFVVEPGEYRVRVYTIDFAVPTGDDYYGIYSIEMWQQDFSERRVLKKYQPKKG
jgi:hypothetical protein